VETKARRPNAGRLRIGSPSGTGCGCRDRAGRGLAQCLQRRKIDVDELHAAGPEIGKMLQGRFQEHGKGRTHGRACSAGRHESQPGKEKRRR